MREMAIKIKPLVAKKIKVDCVFIAAGGRGYRASKISHGNGKQFVIVNGKPLLYYVIKSVLSLDVLKVIVSIGDFSLSDQNIKLIMREIRDPRLIIRRTPGVELVDVPTYLKNEITFPFLYLYGHSPQSTSYLTKLISLVSSENEQIVSCYKLTTQKSPRIGTLRKKQVIDIKRVNKNYSLKKNEFYISAPYVFSSIHGYEIVESTGTVVRGIQNIIPAEFNYVSDFLEVKRKIQSSLKHTS